MSAAVPSWIASLNDPVLKADMTAAAGSGSITEASMAQLFTDLASELTTNHATLSASQLDDLKTIATNLNVGETASAYVTYLVDALVDGNAANASWTGGGNSEMPLGNLGVGATAAQLNELAGKWFLGTDLPSDIVAMSGSPTFDISYSAVSAPLFSASGPSISDINQGDLGDCFLLASLAEVALQNPVIIESMITNNDNGTYGVRFYVDGAARYVTVNDQLPDGGTIFNTANGLNNAADDWGALIEKAYAQLQASGVVTGNDINDGNSFSTFGNGGAPEYILEEITDASSINDFNANGSSWSLAQYNDDLSYTGGADNLSTGLVLSALASDLAAGNDLILSSNTNAYDSSGRLTLVADHALSIYGVDTATGMLDIRNPWGVYPNQNWDTTFQVGLSTLLADGDTITVDNTAATVNNTAAALPPMTAPGTTAITVAQDTNNSGLEIYDIGNNSILSAASLGQISAGLEFSGFGSFDGSDPADMMLRSTSGNFQIDDISSNQITSSIALGNVGNEWQVAGFAALNGSGGDTDMVLSDTNNGELAYYAINNNAVAQYGILGTLPTDFQVVGFGDFSGNAGENDLLMRTPTGDFMVYDIQANAIVGQQDLGNVGNDWQVLGVGDFSTNPNETDFLLRDADNGNIELYDITGNQVSNADNFGNVGVAWQVVGFGNFNGNANETDMLMQNSSTGAFEYYDIKNNQVFAAGSMGQCGLEWHFLGVAA
jgi:Calpain family cysteine protease